MPDELGRVVELGERLIGEVESGQDSRGFDQERGRAAVACGEDRLAGDVGQILLERAADERGDVVAIHAGRNSGSMTAVLHDRVH